MKNRGKLVACDTADWRLDRSGQRLRRAGASNVERHALSSERDPWVKRHAKSFDRVLVDAPCLGVGSWRRNPDAKWRATPNDLAELQIRQHDILSSAARLVKPGGRLAYVTCSLLREENEAQAERFLAETADFTLHSAGLAWTEAFGTPCPAGGDYLRLTPAQHGTDGFFVALFERKPLHRTRDQPMPRTAKTMIDRILILDFGSQVTQLIARRVRENGVYSEIHPYTMSAEAIRAFRAEGRHPLRRTGLGDPIDHAARTRYRVLHGRAGAGDLLWHADDVLQLGGGVRPSDTQEFGRATIDIVGDSPLFDGLWPKGSHAEVWMSHGDKINAIPPAFRVTATTGTAPYASIAAQRV